MECKEPLEQLRHDLIRKGLPADYVGRAVQELADHHADLVEATPADSAAPSATAWQRLGNVESLAKELARKYHQRSFAGRHPVLTFVVAPLPAMLLFWVATFAVTWGTLGIIGEAWMGERDASAMRGTLTPANPMVVWPVYALHLATLVFPPAIGALWYCRLARKSGRGIRWAITSCALVTILACILFSDLRLPVDGQEGRLVFGITLTHPLGWRVPRDHIFQTLAPLAVLAYAVWRAYREQPIVRREQVGA